MHSFPPGPALFPLFTLHSSPPSLRQSQKTLLKRKDCRIALRIVGLRARQRKIDSQDSPGSTSAKAQTRQS